MEREDDDTRKLTGAVPRTPTVAPQSRSARNATEAIHCGEQSERSEVVVNVVPAERRRGFPCLGLAYRCVGTLSMFGLMLFLLGATIVWSTREAMARSSPSLENIEAIIGEGFARKVVVSVETTETPTEDTRRARMRLEYSATDAPSVTESATSETTATVDPACQLNTDAFFCKSAVQGWYYKDGTCRSTAQDHYAVCPQLIGKLTSERDCRSRCFLFHKKNCAGFQTTLRPCSSSDLSRSWYFFNVTLGRCVEWDYPDGACPNVTAGQGHKTEESYDTQLSHVESDCDSACIAETASRKPECERPSGLVACPAELMKHAYFYSELLGSTGDCYRADQTTLAGHRCVNPAALFATEEECVHKCASERS